MEQRGLARVAGTHQQHHIAARAAQQQAQQHCAEEGRGSGRWAAAERRRRRPTTRRNGQRPTARKPVSCDRLQAQGSPNTTRTARVASTTAGRPVVAAAAARTPSDAISNGDDQESRTRSTANGSKAGSLLLALSSPCARNDRFGLLHALIACRAHLDRRWLAPSPWFEPSADLLVRAAPPRAGSAPPGLRRAFTGSTSHRKRRRASRRRHSSGRPPAQALQALCRPCRSCGPSTCTGTA